MNLPITHPFQPASRWGRTNFKVIQLLLIVTLLVGSFWAVGPKPVAAQVGTECARPESFPRAIMKRRVGNGLTDPPLYRGQGSQAQLLVPRLDDPRYLERNVRYGFLLGPILAQTLTASFPMPVTGTGDSQVDFTFPTSVPTGSYIFRIERQSDVFDTLGNYLYQRRLIFCSLPTTVTDPPPPVGPLSSVSAASFVAPVAPDSIVAAFGQNLAVESKAATLPLPTNLSGTSVKVTDSARAVRSAAIFSVSPNQVNYLLPPETAPGQATVEITSGSGQRSAGTVQVNPVAPGLIAQNSNGKGVAAANALRIKADNSQIYEPVSRFDSVSNSFVPVEIDLSTDQVYLILYGTGLRRAGSVTLKIGGLDVAAQWFGPQPDNVGTDQINVLLPTSLIGRKVVDVQLFANGIPSNVVQVSIK